MGYEAQVLALRRRTSVVLLTLLLVLYRIYRRMRSPRGAPSAPGHWLLGILPEFARAMERHTHHELIHRWHRDHGDTVVCYLPMQPTIVDTIDPRNVEHILKGRFDNYIKGNWFYERLNDLLGDGIFNVDGSMWHSQRKTASQMFTQNRFKNQIWRVVDRNTSKVVDILRQVEPGGTVDLFNLMNRFTLDTIGEVGFAKDIGSLHDPSSPFLRSFDRCQQVCMTRFILPFWRLRRLLRLGDEGDCVEHFKRLDAYARKTVRELKASLSGAPRPGEPISPSMNLEEAVDSFVGIFVKEGEAKGEPLNEDFIRDMVLNFLIAGRDTTAQALSWCFFLLMRNPEVEQRVLEEIQSVCGARDVTYDDLNRLKYLHAVLSESLRLYPSVPYDSKVAISDDTLPDGTWIPRGTVVQFNPYSMGRSRKIWGDDAEGFRPERWVSAEPPNPYAYPVFNAGPRECLGKRLSLVEMKTLIVGVLRSVKLTLSVPPEAIRPDTQLTIGMSSGLPCKVERRSDA